MINNQKVIVILPAYNAAQTLERTVDEIPFDSIDEIILGDDNSRDNTIEVAERIGIKHIIKHESNKGYGANQKTCYSRAIELEADIIVMLHPDYQYMPRLIPAMAYLVAYDIYPVVLGSRILGKGALKGHMPLYKYIGNRILTFFQNIMLGTKLSEFHTGFRAYSTSVLIDIDYQNASEDFIFDNQILARIIDRGYEIGEISCPANYFPEASSIGLKAGTIYALGVLAVSFKYFFRRIRRFIKKS
jgi:glycosyltransferase involved in cell wall biosynthesis